MSQTSMSGRSTQMQDASSRIPPDQLTQMQDASSRIPPDQLTQMQDNTTAGAAAPVLSERQLREVSGRLRGQLRRSRWPQAGQGGALSSARFRAGGSLSGGAPNTPKSGTPIFFLLDGFCLRHGCSNPRCNHLLQNRSLFAEPLNTSVLLSAQKGVPPPKCK